MQGIGIKHKNKYTDDFYKRSIDSLYRSCSKINEGHFSKTNQKHENFTHSTSFPSSQ